MSKEIVETPVNHEQRGSPKFPYRGGPGEYDGEDGLPKRTHSPNAVPEKVYDHEGDIHKGKGGRG